MNFKGTYTALITPFRSDESIDYDTLTSLIERQIHAGIDGLVPVGTTGESPTLSNKEHIKVIQHVVEIVNGRCKIVAGTGANSTAEAIELTLAAKSFGIDGTLQVTPYYNKPNNTGLVRHFSSIADLGVPVILYNVPGRTACEIPISVVKELSNHDNIISIKEASGLIDRVTMIKNSCSLEILSGDDNLALSMIKEGACGVISVASNIIPKQISEMINSALENNFKKANSIHNNFAKLFDDLFIDTNPIPIKAASAMLNLIEEVYRLPLCSMSNNDREILYKTLQISGVL